MIHETNFAHALPDVNQTREQKNDEAFQKASQNLFKSLKAHIIILAPLIN